MEEKLSDDEGDYVTDDITTKDFDQTYFQNNYEKLKKKYITRPYLTSYEKTKVLSERSQQIANGSLPLISNPQNYENVYEIAMEELKQKKIPFIISRPINNAFENWKLEDLQII